MAPVLWKWGDGVRHQCLPLPCRECFTAPGYDIVAGMVLGADGSIWAAGYYDELFHIQQDGTETAVSLPSIDDLG